MSVKTIKGIRNDKWMKLKMLANKQNVSMGRLVEIMIDNYQSNSDKAWEKILNPKKMLSKKDIEELEKETLKIRKERGFRNGINI